MSSIPEVPPCCNRVLAEDVCYTKHAGVVISLGRETALYEYVLKEIPEAHQLVVNVASSLPAPPRHERVKRAFFPDASVVSRIRQQQGFSEVVQQCELVLQRYGIVLVMCKGGNHRAPTVADCLKRKGRFVIHATLATRRAFCCTHIATLVHACVRCSNGVEFYSRLIRESEDLRCESQLCVGWDAADLETCEVDPTVSFLRAGSNVQVLEMRGCECLVRDRETGHTCALPVTWLVPRCVYMERENVSDVR